MADLLVLTDCATTRAVEETVSRHADPTPLIADVLRMTLAYNQGAAFSTRWRLRQFDRSTHRRSRCGRLSRSGCWAPCLACGVAVGSMPSNRLLVSAYLARHARLWLLVRVLVSALFLHAEQNPWRIAPGGIAALVVLSATVNMFEMYRRREFELLGNLGVPRAAQLWWAFVPPLLGETILLAFRA